MKICILHHVEPMWEESFNPVQLRGAIRKHFRKHHQDYDLVILTSLEGFDGDMYSWALELVDRHEQWSYTWDNPEDYPEWYEDNGIDTEDIISANGHEWAYVYPWIRELKDAEWFLMGGHESECLQDLVDTLDYLGAKYTKIHDCIF